MTGHGSFAGALSIYFDPDGWKSAPEIGGLSLPAHPTPPRSGITCRADSSEIWPDK